MYRITICVLLINVIGVSLGAQTKFQFDGQGSGIVNFSPDNTLDFFAGVRYIPDINYNLLLDSAKSRNLYFEGSVNISGSVGFHAFDTTQVTGDIQPYRIWVRYTGKRTEFRVGLQKIDFGSASILRTLQWFNQIDPRDPLQLTNGVYAGLGRYYFQNNANIWIWALYGNEKTRGFDAVKTYEQIPEFGGRVQYPVPKGEIAVSYHHREADSRELPGIPAYDQIPEDRIGIDGKWDVGIGLWFEGTHIRKSKMVDILTNQTLLNVGMDYTFGIGNGLNATAEHLILSYDKEPLQFKSPENISAVMASYPIALYDNLSLITNYNWPSKDISLFLNYQHQFKKITGYVMAYYNPATQQGIQKNELVQTFSGPGIRLMAVYNH